MFDPAIGALVLRVSLGSSNCPPDMVTATQGVCIERLAWPGYDRPMLGISALPESYLALGGETWDAEALCASRGRRVCQLSEWRAACAGTKRDACGKLVPYRAPSWNLVASRDAQELLRLDQYPDADELTACVGATGAVGMLAAEEWVRVGDSYALTAAYWSRAGECGDIITSHSPAWHDYASTVRCCLGL